MASTNPFPHANSNTDGIDGSTSTRASRRSGNRKKNSARKNSVQSAPQQSYLDSGAFDGWPSLESLKPVLIFLCFPAVVVLGVIIAGGLPRPVLYLAGCIIGIIVAMSTFKTVEITVVCILLYLPFAKSYVIPIAPGLNGTNMLILLGLGTAFMYAAREKVKFVVWPPGSILVISFGVYTALSAFTILQHPGGGYLLKAEILSYKSWLDQFIIYLILVALIRDKEGAKRAVVYIMIGSMAVVIYSIPEMLEKMGRSSIEKSRILGPQAQANNFGGFVAYTLLPFLAFFLVFIKDIRAWMLTPYFIIALKVLLTTFSRGAYVAMAVGGFIVGYYRGKMFLLTAVVLAICVVVAFPSVMPASISARMGGLVDAKSAASSAHEEEKLDKSALTRFVMWEAAGQMMIESPILGKGFKSFPFLKEQYIHEEVEEDDPHSMYFYLGSQMGIPALVLFIVIMGYMFKLGRFHAQNKTDRFIRAVGIGGTAIPVCYAVVCIFGSRAVALNFTIYFWAYLIILQVLKKASDESDLALAGVKMGRSALRSKRPRRNTAGVQADMASKMETVLAPELELKPQRKSRAGQRAPKRGAAAFMAQEAEKKALESRVRLRLEAQKAAEQSSGGKSLTSQRAVQPAYETRAVRKARQAAEDIVAARPKQRQRKR
jgi:putative inorganic carbon (HCO3(-)) transporter